MLTGISKKSQYFETKINKKEDAGYLTKDENENLKIR